MATTSKAQKRALHNVVLAEFQARKNDDPSKLQMSIWANSWCGVTNTTLQALVRKDLIIIHKPLKEGTHIETARFRIELTTAGRQVGIDELYDIAPGSMETTLERSAKDSAAGVVAAGLMSAIRTEIDSEELNVSASHGFKAEATWIVTGFSEFVTVAVVLVKNFRTTETSVHVSMRYQQTIEYQVDSKDIAQFVADVFVAGYIAAIVEGLEATIIASMK